MSCERDREEVRGVGNRCRNFCREEIRALERCLAGTSAGGNCNHCCHCRFREDEEVRGVRNRCRDFCREEIRDLEDCLAGESDFCRRCCERCRCRNNGTTWGR